MTLHHHTCLQNIITLCEKIQYKYFPININYLLNTIDNIITKFIKTLSCLKKPNQTSQWNKDLKNVSLPHKDETKDNRYVFLYC